MYLYILYLFQEHHASKRRKPAIRIPKTSVATFNWVSKYSLEGMVTKGGIELGEVHVAECFWDHGMAYQL